MKNKFAALSTLSLLSAAMSAQAIELTDYQIPDSDYEEAFLQGSLNTQSGNQDQTSYDANLNASWQAVSSSMMQTRRIQAGGLAEVSRGPDEGDKSVDNSSGSLLAGVDNYFKADSPWLWYGSGELGYLSSAEDPFVKAGVGIGYGRVINATPLAKVMRIEEELREHGVITGRLTDAQYLALARVVGREDQFRSQYGADEYLPYFVAALEDELKAAGVLSAHSLGAIGALYIDRVLNDEPIGVRKHGWIARVGTGVVLQDYTGESDNDPTLDASFEYAVPYGFKGQFVDLLSYSTIFGDNVDQLVSNRMSYTYELSDRVDWENTWLLDYQITGDDEAEDIITNALASTFRYYLSNRLSAGATVSATQVEDNIDDNQNDDLSVATLFDIRYRLK